MSYIKPFRALRPTAEYADKVAALPFDVYTTKEARAASAGNPYSFLHVDKAEIDLPDSVSQYDETVYEKAKQNLDKLVSDGILIQDPSPCFYIYRLTAQGRSQTGLACCVSAQEYEQGLIKKHELTRRDKEQDRINHVNTLSAHTGPIFTAYKSNGTDEPRALIAQWTAGNDPVYDFTATDGVRHTVWVVDDPAAIAALTAIFTQLPALYIADGHHRSASAAHVARQRMACAAKNTGGEPDDLECGYYLSVVFPHDELTILDYNRLVRDLNGMDAQSFLLKVSEDFDILKCDGPVKPSRQRMFGMYVAGNWYQLVYKRTPADDVVAHLDVSILQTSLLSPILCIRDPQTDKRIEFAGGSRGPGFLSQCVDSGEMAAAFTLFPTSMEELMAIADANRIMPPKSTWFEPKLRSGLLIHTF